MRQYAVPFLDVDDSVKFHYVKAITKEEALEACHSSGLSVKGWVKDLKYILDLG